MNIFYLFLFSRPVLNPRNDAVFHSRLEEKVLYWAWRFLCRTGSIHLHRCRGFSHYAGHHRKECILMQSFVHLRVWSNEANVLWTEGRWGGSAHIAFERFYWLGLFTQGWSCMWEGNIFTALILFFWKGIWGPCVCAALILAIQNWIEGAFINTCVCVCWGGGGGLGLAPPKNWNLIFSSAC